MIIGLIFGNLPETTARNYDITNGSEVHGVVRSSEPIQYNVHNVYSKVYHGTTAPDTWLMESAIIIETPEQYYLRTCSRAYGYKNDFFAHRDHWANEYQVDTTAHDVFGRKICELNLVTKERVTRIVSDSGRQMNEDGSITTLHNQKHLTTSTRTEKVYTHVDIPAQWGFEIYR